MNDAPEEPSVALREPVLDAHSPRIPPVVFVLARLLVGIEMEELGVATPANDNSRPPR